MSFESDLVTFLRSYAPVSSLVDSRIYPDVLPQSVATPAIVYQKISETRTESHNGFSHLTKVRVQFSCWSPRVTEVLALSLALKSLHGYKGVWGTRRIDKVGFEQELDDFEPDTKLFARKLDLMVSHYED